METERPPVIACLRRPSVKIIHDGYEFSGPDEASLQEFIALHDMSKQEAARKRELWGKGGREGMARLCALFPTLRDADGIAPWNTDRFLLWQVSSGACSGAKHAGRFVLSVWNTSTDWIDLLKREAADKEPDDPNHAALWKGLQALKLRIAGQLLDDMREDARERSRSQLGLPRDAKALLGAQPAKVEESLQGWFESAGRFNVTEAIGVWDEQHRAAFLAWCGTPFWP